MINFYATYIVPASALFPIFFGLKNYRLLTDAFKILLFFIIAGSLLNLAALILIAHHHYTLFLMHIYGILEFTFLTLVFSKVFDGKWRMPLYLLIAVFDVICVINFLFIQNKIEFNTYTRPIGAFIIAGYCMSYIIKNGNEERSWSDDNFNWINTGLLMYYATGFVMFISFNFFLKETVFSDIIWTFHNTVLLIEYVLFAIGFSKCRSLITTTSIS